MSNNNKFSIGETIYGWTISSQPNRVLNSGKYTVVNYEITCKCGTKRIVRSNLLAQLQLTGIDKVSLKKECGDCAYKKQKENKTEDKLIQSMYKNAANKASKRKENGINFNLTIQEYTTIIKQNCVFCGRQPNNNFRFKHKSGDVIFKYQGIDRVDSNKHYTIDNVVPCCENCNKGKATNSLNDYSEYLKELTRFNQGSTARERIDKYLLTSIVTSSEVKWEGPEFFN